MGEGVGRTLLLHSGGAKTGTSAVQNLLREGADRLSSAGVCYALAPAPRDASLITSGNAPPLAHALQKGDAAEAARLLEAYLGGRATGLASSETLEALGEPEWRLLLGLAGQAGLALRVVHVARDPLPLLLSVYDQKVKRHGEARPVGAFAERHSLRVFAALRLLDRLAREGAIGLRVLRYESHREALAPAILGALGLDPALLDGLAAEGARVNRSLSREERALLLRLNARTGERHSRALSDLLIAADPGRAPEPPSDPRLPAILRERHGADVAWANATFFPEGGGLELPSDALPEAPPDALPDGPAGLAFAWALERLSEAEALPDAAPVAREVRRLAALPPPPGAALPEGFDPVGYLLLNPQLVAKGVNPSAHVLRHGLRKGLRWS